MGREICTSGLSIFTCSQEHARLWRHETTQISRLLQSDGDLVSHMRHGRKDNAHLVYRQLHAGSPQLKASLEAMKTTVSYQRQHTFQCSVPSARQSLPERTEKYAGIDQSNVILQIAVDLGRIAEKEKLMNSQVSGLAADLHDAKEQLLQSQELLFQHNRTCSGLESDLDCAVQASGSACLFS
jgi:hypothetical protein